MNTVEYDNDAEEIRVTTGIQTFRFTSSSTNESKAEVDTYAEVKYYATGVLPENPASIVSTKPAFFKANEGVQFVDNNTDNPVRPNPLAQTFKVENFEGGCFVTSVDLFFAKKSKNIPLRVYLTDVASDKPGKNLFLEQKNHCYQIRYLSVSQMATLVYQRENLLLEQVLQHLVLS